MLAKSLELGKIKSKDDRYIIEEGEIGGVKKRKLKKFFLVV